MSFRPLNVNEKTAIGSAFAKGKIPESHPLLSPDTNVRVSYEFMQGGFCVCVILINTTRDNDVGHEYMFRGASRRSYKDPKKQIRGEMLAFKRAVLYSRAVELR